MIEIPHNIGDAYIEKATEHMSETFGVPLRLEENSYGNFAVYIDNGNAYDRKITPGYLTKYALAVWFAGVWLHVDEPEVFNAKQDS